MPQATQSASRSVTITDAWTKPINQTERETAWQAIVGALRGTWGNGTWDGSGDPTWPSVAQGQWDKHRTTWSASLQADIDGVCVVTFPFTVIRGIVKVWKINGSEAVLQPCYIEKGNTLSIEYSGRVIIELNDIKNNSNVGI